MMARVERETTDAALVARALDGDRAAFGQLVARHRAGVGRLLQVTFGARAGVDDLLQETFLQAYLNLEQLRDPGRFGAWARGIAINLARMQVRAGRMIMVPWDERWSSHIEKGAPRTPEHATERKEMLARVRDAIEDLSPAEREAILRVYMDGLSHREAARLLDTSEGAVKVRVHRGRKRLRRALAAEFAGRPRQKETAMIEVTVHDVLARLPEDEAWPEVDKEKPAVEQAEQWIVRLSMSGHRVILLKETDGERLLPIWVGPFEAEAVIIHLQGPLPMRPLTFDLVNTLLSTGKMTLARAAVSRLEERVYYGTLTVQTDDGATHEVDCRPSDAINLAVRMGAPILVAPEVMARQGVSEGEDDESVGCLPTEEGQVWRSLLTLMGSSDSKALNAR